jgi:hypothetical protein
MEPPISLEGNVPIRAAFDDRKTAELPSIAGHRLRLQRLDDQPLIGIRLANLMP